MERKLNCVLLVDDDEGHNYLTRLVIEEAAAARHIRAVWNGREAIDYVTGRGKFGDNGDTCPEPDLILLDINMPVMDGWDFMRQYGGLDEARKRRIMIVMLSTSANPDDRERALTIPDIADFRTKPLTPQALQEMLRRYFRERASG
jgi:CheY-like chemotaxis protein